MLALATLLLLTAPTAEAKGKPGRKSKKTEAAAEKADTTKKEKKGYEELLKGAVTDKGMFDVHRKGTDINKGDIIYVTELSRLGRCAYMVIAIISHCLMAKANIIEIRDDKWVKDDSNSVQAKSPSRQAA